MMLQRTLLFAVIIALSKARESSLRSRETWGFDDSPAEQDTTTTYHEYPHPECGRPGICYLEDLIQGTETPLVEGGVLNTYYLKLGLQGNRLTVRCDPMGRIDHTKFRFDNRVRDEHSAPYHLNGDTNGTPNGSEYLDDSVGIKFFSFEAYLWGVKDENGSELPCFRQRFFLKAEACLISFLC